MSIDSGIRLLDTNVVLRLVIDDVPVQTQRVDSLFEDVAPGSLWLTDVVAMEAVYVMEKVYRYPRPVIARTLQFVIGHRAVRASRQPLLAALQLYQADKQVSYADAYLCAFQQQTKDSLLVTFDNRLKKHAKTQQPE